jgi:xanthine/CO dehydrogenase XdhC/CoxF family maturation factor
MSLSLQRLLPLFERERALHHPMVLATVVRKDGSTYTKPGAQLLLASNGEYAGLLSGGCLEADLAEHGRDTGAWQRNTGEVRHPRLERSLIWPGLGLRRRDGHPAAAAG